MKIYKNILFFCFMSVMLLISSNAYSQLSGNYTIGSGENYATITSAVSALVINGVNGPVVFNIITGSYDESVTIDSVAGTSSVNTVVFKSQSGNASDVTIHTSSIDTIAVKINGADFITFQSLTFNNLLGTTSERIRIFFRGNCEGIKILNNIFLGGINDFGLYSLNALMTNLLIDGNYFNLKQGVFMKELVLKSHYTKITNNEFDCTFGISIYNHDNISIERNNLKTTSVINLTPGPYCIFLAVCNGELRILQNKMICVSTNQFPSDGLKIDPFNGTNALIANNFISLDRGTCMYLGDCINLNIYFNTLRCSSSHSGNITLINSTSVTSKNNLFVQLGNSGINTMTYYLSNAVMNSDYNDFYYLGNLMLSYNNLGYVTNLTQFQTLANQDLNSVERPVNFVSDTNLHLTGSSIGDPLLTGTPIPGITVDIDGQPRNPLYPYMGADEPDVPLPVELISFTSVINNRDVNLLWRTNSENSNSGFDIERLKNDGNSGWSKIGFVNGSGTTNSPRDYFYTDKNLNTGKYKYRLKQIDYNGNFEYFNLSNEIVIGIPEKFSLSQNYPNPFNPNTIINYDIPSNVKDQMSDVKLIIYNSLGKEIFTLVNEKKDAGSYLVDFDGSNFPSGIYFYKLTAGDFSETKRMILLK